jgi:hypothetical protein
MAVLLVSMDLFALATVPAGPDEAGGPPPTKFYTRRDNVIPLVLYAFGRVVWAI